MGSREFEEELRRDPVNTVSHLVLDAIASTAISDCSQLEPNFTHQSSTTDWEVDRQMQYQRDRLLETTARVANVLLTLENFDEAINTALKILVEGTGCDRIKVLENSFDPSSSLPKHSTVIYESVKPGILRQMAHLESRRTSNQGIEAFLERYFVKGNGFSGLLEEWVEPLQSAMAGFQVQSSCSVPIRLNGQWWGMLVLNYCREAIQISPSEIAVLRTIADCIGSAIQRNRSQQERAQVAQQRTADLEEYNQRLLQRDRLLEVIAKATNVLLTLDSIEVAINTALGILLEGVGCDRLEILENIYDSSSPLPIRYTNIYNCLSPNFKIAGTEIEPVQAAQLHAFFGRHFLEADGFGGLLEDWDEPLRSLLAELQIQSSYAVPIRVNGEWWGILCFDYFRAPIQISPAEFAVLKTIADCIGSAIQRDRTQKALLQSEQNRSAELTKANTAMRRSIDWLAHEPDMNAFLGHLLEELATQFDAQDAMIFLYDAEKRMLQALLGIVDDEITFSPPFTQKISVDEWLGWDILLRSPKPRPFLLDSEPHLFLPEYLEYHRRRNNQSIVCTLLPQDEQPLGLIGFGCPRKTFSENELQLVQSLAQQVTLAIQLTRLAEEANQSALLQERTRLAREIHDTLAQAFGGISMQLQAAAYFAMTRPETAQSHVLMAQNLAKDGLAEARRSVWTLYLDTIEYEDLAQAIAKFIGQTTLNQSVPINLTIDGTPYCLHADLGLNLLRIAQEAITNALRHAQAQTIHIHLSYSSQSVQLNIYDDGCGFEPQSHTHGFGLLGMQQRAARIGATWHLVSHAGQGTTIKVTLINPQTA